MCRPWRVTADFPAGFIGRHDRTAADRGAERLVGRLRLAGGAVDGVDQPARVTVSPKRSRSSWTILPKDRPSCLLRITASAWWLWAFVTRDTTVYAIQEGRGFAQAAAVLGADYAGVLQRDGWAPYRQFVHAADQTCLAHLLRRCRRMMLDHPHHPFAPQVQALLQAALATRDRYRDDDVSEHGLAVARGLYVNRLGDLLTGRPSRLADARRFAAHLTTEFDAVFSFLFDPTLDATNWRAEHALRPAVITRKTCGGGNRTPRGAQTQQVLASVLRTAQQRGLDATDLIASLLTAPISVVLDVLQSTALH